MRTLSMAFALLCAVAAERTFTAQDSRDDLVGKVWRSTDPSASPGTLRIFLSNGTLVMDSCGETYRLAAWKRVDKGHVEWTEDGVRIGAEIVQLTADVLRLRLQLKGETRESYQRATVPSVCPDMPRGEPRKAEPQNLQAQVEPDPYVDKQRVIVMTDIANEPDDQMSLVRFLVYSTDYDVEGLIATTSTWMKHKVRPDVIRTVLDAYGDVQKQLAQHAQGFPTADSLRSVVVEGQPSYGMAAVGSDKTSAGAELIIRSAERPDPRPLWVLAWGGTNTLAQALMTARATKTPQALDAIVAKLRVYAISDQDDAGPWIRREFPRLQFIGIPSTTDGEQYYLATWTGISGDRFYRNAPGADFTTFTTAWVNDHIRSKGPLGKHYPFPCCIHEGDTPSFLGLINNGLASFMSPTYGGWGGRYVWRTYFGESRPSWTQGGDSFPGRDSSRDAVAGVDGQVHTTDQATIWRWRTAFQHDFAARMDWTVKAPRDANHNPIVVVNGQSGKAPILVNGVRGKPFVLDADGTRDPDGHTLKYRWFFYSEAGTGIPDRPVVVGGFAAIFGGTPGEGGIPSAPEGGLPEPTPRVALQNESTMRATVTPRVAGTAHIILAVEDDGTPTLTSYRRVIVTITERGSGQGPLM
jgi:Cellulose-binding Sde182, nucleoside hydrolase-like domain/Cellulose-binding protein Sde0182, C-terminal domain